MEDDLVKTLNNRIDNLCSSLAKGWIELARLTSTGDKTMVQIELEDGLMRTRCEQGLVRGVEEVLNLVQELKMLVVVGDIGRMEEVRGGGREENNGP